MCVYHKANKRSFYLSIYLHYYRQVWNPSIHIYYLKIAPGAARRLAKVRVGEISKGMGASSSNFTGARSPKHGCHLAVLPLLVISGKSHCVCAGHKSNLPNKEEERDIFGGWEGKDGEKGGVGIGQEDRGAEGVKKHSPSH